MNILIMNAHWNNRGDEAATRAMIDHLQDKYPDAKIKVLLLTSNIKQFRYDDVECRSNFYPRKRDLYFEVPLFVLSRGKLMFSKRGKEFCQLIKEADIVIHAPGGPSIGDIYFTDEIYYLYRMLIAKVLHKPYVFYAPSMGPFNTEKHKFRNALRRSILNGASVFCVREPISKKYIEKLGNVKLPTVTLDSAFQYPVNIEKNQQILNEYQELRDFINQNEKIIGITITDLKWNPKYAQTSVSVNINDTFTKMIEYLNKLGYAVLFIPQLFGNQHDNKYMSTFANEKCMVMSEDYDCYFQQFIISKMHALIGMRYHSNIFSAKMGCPFVSVAYEQKMSGFMKKIGLEEYCIDINDLSFNLLKEKFSSLEKNYNSYKEVLVEKSVLLQKESSKTTELVCECIESKVRK